MNLRDKRISLPEGEKNAIGRIVYLSKDALDALQAWMEIRDKKTPFLFHAQGKRTLGYAAARMVLKKYLSKAGLAEKGYTLHRLRHTFASDMLNAGMRLEYLQQLLGHSDIKVTRVYARLTDKRRESEYFRTMAIIEKGEIHGHYQLDSEIQAILEEKRLLDRYGKELS